MISIMFKISGLICGDSRLRGSSVFWEKTEQSNLKIHGNDKASVGTTKPTQEQISWEWKHLENTPTLPKEKP